MEILRDWKHDTLVVVVQHQIVSLWTKALWCSTVNLHQLFALLAGAEISLYQTSSRADKQHDMALDAHYLA